MISLLGNCSKTEIYGYNEEQVEQIFSRLTIELRNARVKFDCPEAAKKRRFTLSSRAFAMPDIAQQPMPALHMEWCELENYLTQILSALVGRMVPVEITYTEYELWSVKISEAPLSSAEFDAICTYVGTSEDEREMMNFDAGPVTELLQSAALRLITPLVPFTVYSTGAGRTGIWFYGQPTDSLMLI